MDVAALHIYCRHIDAGIKETDYVAFLPLLNVVKAGIGRLKNLGYIGISLPPNGVVSDSVVAFDGVCFGEKMV